MTSCLLIELETILEKSVESVINYEKVVFEQLLEKSSPKVVLFGCGNLGKKCLEGLRTVGIEPVAFSDNNSSLWNKNIDGISVLPPEIAAQIYGKDALFIITIWNASPKCQFVILRNQLEQLGCLNVASFMTLFWKYPDLFLPHYCVELPHKIYEQREDVLKVFHLWKDDYSKKQYINQLKWRTSLDFESLSIAKDPQYFSSQVLPKLSNEVFIDCGAFDGDTLKYLINNQYSAFKKIICFEPDPNNFEKLKNYVSGLEDEVKEKVTIYQKATGNKREKLLFTALGLSSSAITETGEIEVESVPLDEILTDTVPTFIKMDIEGAEIDTLIGASKIIKEYAPILAIACYHLQAHLWQIPLLIKSIQSDYSFFLEQYGADGLEMVFYAIPNSRL